MRCPACGGWAPAAARTCKFCSVELASVRCARCFALHYAGATVCSACGATLGLEGELGPIAGKCPRCAEETLSRVQVGVYDVIECSKCTGLMVEHATLARITKASEAERAASVLPPPPPAPRAVEPVRYLPCPLCGTVMNRRNFGEASGVIVDVCKPHGIWFDAEELSRVLTFITSGGLEAARARAIDREKTQRALEAIRVHRMPGVYEQGARQERVAESFIEALLAGLLR